MKVFISSTSKDLVEHRKAVIEAVLRAQHYPIAMEFFGSSAGSGQVVSLNYVHQAECFVGIYAHRYGYRPGDGKSVTEQEYDEAVRLGIPRLLFRVADGYEYPLIETHRETDRVSKKMLDDFLSRTAKDNVYASFTNPDNLAMLVIQALTQPGSTLSAASAPASPSQTIINASNFSGGVGNTINANNVSFGNTTTDGKPKKRRP